MPDADRLECGPLAGPAAQERLAQRIPGEPVRLPHLGRGGGGRRELVHADVPCPFDIDADRRTGRGEHAAA
ncbi:hypothetical protein [Streptomyces atratus]|uniref:hypothetical protein n=1 Tax=Streptomyces atratus TaxID=1893 RepID=UPI0013008896|nr:hypothetical protein [Streptomyces atratus]